MCMCMCVCVCSINRTEWMNEWIWRVWPVTNTPFRHHVQVGRVLLWDTNNNGEHAHSHRSMLISFYSDLTHSLIITFIYSVFTWLDRRSRLFANTLYIIPVVQHPRRVELTSRLSGPIRHGPISSRRLPLVRSSPIAQKFSYFTLN